MIPIPQNDVYIPEVQLNWVQEAFTNVLLDAIDAHMEQVAGKNLDVWGVWENEQTLIWETEFDLVTAMGFKNVMLPFRHKEFAYQRSLYQEARGVVSEAIRTKNLQLYLSTRFQIEKQRQMDYLGNAKNYQKWVKYDLDGQVARNEAELKKLAGAIEGESIRLKQSLALVEEVERRINLAVRLLTAQGEVLTGIARNELEAKKATVTIARAGIEVKLAKLEADKAVVRAEVIKADIRKLQSQAKLVQAETMVEEGRKYDIQADILTIQAQAREIEVLQAELALIIHQRDTAIELANEKIAAFDAILDERRVHLDEMEVAQEADIAANVLYAENTKKLGDANNLLSLANDQSRLIDEDLRAEMNIAEAEARMQELLDRSELTAAEAASRLAELAGKARLSTAEVRVRLQELLDKARLDAAEARVRLTSLHDRSRLTSAETDSRMSELSDRAALDATQHTVRMTELTARANLTAAESAAKMVEIADRAKIIASDHEAKTTELIANLGVTLARTFIQSERDETRDRIAALMEFLRVYVENVQRDIDLLVTTDKAAREALALDSQVAESKAHKQATDILKDAKVENTITEVRE